jgi:branched-chain amino acid aminotransferase
MKQTCINVNGKLVPAATPVISAADHSYRYGDGLFETIRVVSGKINLAGLHFERLIGGMEMLKFNKPASFSSEKLSEEILQLCHHNQCTESARVRLSVSRGKGGLRDFADEISYIIEAGPLHILDEQVYRQGLTIDLFPHARKSCDRLANLKSANYLPYVMAALYAKDNKLGDCLVLNQHDRIADATVANVFFMKNENIITPALSEGCVAGVMRKFLLQEMNHAGFSVHETAVTVYDLEQADEIFLTNAIEGIKPVKQFRNRIYSAEKTKEIFTRFLQTIFS